MIGNYIKKLEKRILYYESGLDYESTGGATKDRGKIAAYKRVIEELQEMLT